jgi:hypothetical protein
VASSHDSTLTILSGNLFIAWSAVTTLTHQYRSQQNKMATAPSIITGFSPSHPKGNITSIAAIHDGVQCSLIFCVEYVKDVNVRQRDGTSIVKYDARAPHSHATPRERYQDVP